MDYEEESALYDWGECPFTDGQLYEMAQRDGLPSASLDELKQIYS